MNAHVDAKRLKAAKPSPAPAAEPAEFSIERAEAMLAASDGSATSLADAFHLARLVNDFETRRYTDAMEEAEAMYPDQPITIRRETFPPVRGRASWGRLAPHWTPSMVEDHARWDLQCELIGRGMGLDEVRRAAFRAEGMLETLAERVLAAPLKGMADVGAVLGVMRWRVEAEALDGPELVAALDRLRDECGSL